MAIISSDGALVPICLRKFDDISTVLSVTGTSVQLAIALLMQR